MQNEWVRVSIKYNPFTIRWDVSFAGKEKRVVCMD